MRWLALTLVAVPFAAPQTALAQTSEIPPPDATAQGDVSVTIYNNDLALVQDKRTLNLPGGRSKQEFPDVSATIRPETVTLSAAGTTIVEQNFDYDLLTPAKLLDKAVGQNVTLIRGDKTETVKVLANNGGTVIQNGNRIEVLNSYDGRVIFNSLPPNLRARPTLSVTLEAASSGPRSATLNYLSTGLGWKSDYVALFDEGAGKIDVQGWITLTNSTGTTFVNANTLLVAGSPGEDDGGAQPIRRFGVRTVNPNIPGNAPGTETANREQLGDFYVYPIKGRTTIANAQQKQVSFLDVSGAPAAKAYFYRNSWLGTLSEAASMDTVLRFSTSREGGLGDALPAGTVRVYMRDARGSPQFIGESAIGHTPMGSRLALRTGSAFDVKVQPTVEKRESIGKDRWRTTMRYKLTNARASAVTVEFAQAGLDSWWNDTKIESESEKSDRTNSDEALWKVTVPANGETSVTAVFLTRY
jgi:hypothetical protein